MAAYGSPPAGPFDSHRFAAAFRAISARLVGDSAAARALPPFAPPSVPNATAAGFFVDSGSGGRFPVDASTMGLRKQTRA